MILTSRLLYPLRFHIIFHYDVMLSMQGVKGSKGEKGPKVQSVAFKLFIFQVKSDYQTYFNLNCFNKTR